MVSMTGEDTQPVLPDMPPDFVWGVATSAYQIEGAASADGRGESIWDRFAAGGAVAHGDTGAVACDHYQRWREDVAIMADLGVDAYRFSVAWPRVLPGGTGPVNQAGLDFYDRLVDELLAHGIRPVATLYHYDLPQALQDRWGGWIGRDTAGAFADYVDIVSRRLGDRVRDWITVNQPWCASWLGHVWGIHAPGFKDLRAGLQAAHHLMLGHGRATAALRSNDARARVGISVSLGPVCPYGQDEADRVAASTVDGTYNRWFLEALFRQGYPPDVVARLADRAPDIRPGDMESIGVPIDFLGVNYYTRTFWRSAPGRNSAGVEEVEIEGVERTAMGWEVYPEGLYEVLTRVHREYGPPSIVITEGGAAFEDTRDLDGRLHDQRRIAYLAAHMRQARRAVESGVPLRGYFVWSLVDNFEWAEGYSKRFGLVYVEYDTQERILKESGRWFREQLRHRSRPAREQPVAEPAPR